MNFSSSSYYVIKLKPEESVGLYGFMNAKKTLAWKDILAHKRINLRTCIDNGISTSKLVKIQPDLREWIKHDKVQIQDFPHLSEWAANPFDHFKCTIGDLVVHRKFIHANALVECKVKFKTLVEKYGLTHELMILLRYTPDDWINLGISKEDAEKIAEDSWTQIFGELSRADLSAMIQRKGCSL